jgi:hypothetical protein
MSAVIAPSGASTRGAPTVDLAVDGVAFDLAREQDLTAFLQIRAEYRVEPDPIVRQFTVPARLLGAPDDRSTRMLGALIEQHGGVVHWLFLLLGESVPERVGENGVANEGNRDSRARRTGADPTGLFESLVRAAVDSPERLSMARQAMDSLSDQHHGDADAVSIRDLLTSLSRGDA